MRGRQKSTHREYQRASSGKRRNVIVTQQGTDAKLMPGGTPCLAEGKPGKEEKISDKMIGFLAGDV